jgi:hypothetical protein
LKGSLNWPGIRQLENKKTVLTVDGNPRCQHRIPEMALIMEYDDTLHKDISDPRTTYREITELREKLDSLQRDISHLTNLVSKSLEEKQYAAIRERERRW